MDAERWLREQLTAFDHGLWIDPTAGRENLAEWSEKWFAGLHVKPKTASGYRQLLDSRILPEFGGSELVGISPAAVRAWMTAMASEGLSASRMRQARGVLHQILNLAVHDGLIGRNPVERVKAPKVRPGDRRYLTAEQLQVLTDAVEEVRPGAGLLVSLLGWVGLRWGEAAALRARRVDSERRRLVVAESLVEINSHLEFGSPKTHESRTVAMPAWLAERMRERVDSRDPDALVFTAPMGGPLRGRNWRRRVWRPALAGTSIGGALVPHELRHTAASLMISSGANIKAVQRQLGHASASMTLDLYGHLYDEDLDHLADALETRYPPDTSGSARPVPDTAARGESG